MTATTFEKPTLKKGSKAVRLKKTTQKEPATPKKSERGGARENAGRPAFEPTPQERIQVETFSGIGVPIHQICALVRDGIHVDTLRAHFETELLKGKAKANAKVGQTLFQKCLSGDTTAVIFWMKTQCGFKETTSIEYPNGMPPVLHINAEDLTDDQLESIIRNNANDS